MTQAPNFHSCDAVLRKPISFEIVRTNQTWVFAIPHRAVHGIWPSFQSQCRGTWCNNGRSSVTLRFKELRLHPHCPILNLCSLSVSPCRQPAGFSKSAEMSRGWGATLYLNFSKINKLWKTSWPQQSRPLGSHVKRTPKLWLSVVVSWRRAIILIFRFFICHTFPQFPQCNYSLYVDIFSIKRNKTTC